MKKILIFVVVLLIVSGSVFGGGSFEYKHSVEDFQGTWKQVNGDSVITIKGNDFEFLNMEIGYAGYGIVSMGWWNKDKVKTEALRFDMYWPGREGRSTKGNFIYLNMDKKQFDLYKKEKNYFFNDFLKKAWEDYYIPISERNNIYTDDIFNKYFKNVSRTLKGGKFVSSEEKEFYAWTYGGGGNPYYFELNGDNLKLTSIYDEETTNTNFGCYLYQLLFCGEFVRVK